MLERHDAPEGRNADLNSEYRKVLTLRPMTDREVPLTGAASMSISDVPSEVHQWLDGDISERAARRVDSRNVDLWSRIDAETSRRRRLETPAHLSQRVMAVLPSKAPSRFELLFRPFRVTPVTAAAVGAGLLAVGAFAARVLFHLR